MPDLPQPNDGTSIATAPSDEAQLGSTTDTGAPAPSARAVRRIERATRRAALAQRHHGCELRLRWLGGDELECLFRWGAGHRLFLWVR